MLIDTADRVEGVRVPTIRRRKLLGAGLAGLTAPTRARAAAEPLPLGALFPFSGPLSLLGDESFRGLDLAADERNAAGGLLGRKLALVRGDAADADAGDRRGQAADRAGALPGDLRQLRLRRGARRLRRHRTGRRAVFRAGCARRRDHRARLQAAVPHRPDRQRLRHDGGRCRRRSAGAALADRAGRRSAWSSCTRTVPPAPPSPRPQQAQAAARGFPPPDRIAYAAAILDFAPIVRRLRGTGADVVLHSGLLNDVLLFHRAMQQAGWRPRMLIGTGGGYALGRHRAGAGHGDQRRDERGHDALSHLGGGGAGGGAGGRRLSAQIRRTAALGPLAGLLRRRARLFFDAIERAGTLDRDKLRAAVLATDIPPGATVAGWGVTFDDHGQNRRAVPFLAQWQNGALLTVAPLSGRGRVGGGHARRLRRHGACVAQAH